MLEFGIIIHTQDGSLTLAAKKAEQLGNASTSVASVLNKAQSAVTSVQDAQTGMNSTAFMSAMAQSAAG